MIITLKVPSLMSQYRDPNCGRPSQELEFRLKEFEQFKLDESERFEQFKRNERIRYIYTPILEE